jgi:hypothetical protein
MKPQRSVIMSKKFIFSAMLACLLALGLIFVSCDNGTISYGVPPVFTLTNIDNAKQDEGSIWFIFGLFPTGTSSNIVLADAKKHMAQNSYTSAIVAYAGGSSSSLLLREPFDYTEWRKDNLCVGMTVEKISKEAMMIYNQYK